jgi:hypothetical protein
LIEVLSGFPFVAQSRVVHARQEQLKRKRLAHEAGHALQDLECFLVSSTAIEPAPVAKLPIAVLRVDASGCDGRSFEDFR